ncbi:MAG: crossover junction endodeoxyribonuclease RuvC [Clostridia bacterium]|nr:crossover junction endodeoxyribonuclease RuvC [Clostridia bacterium]
MVILGIDPGLAIVGFGAVEYVAPRFRVLGFGAIRTEAHTPVGDRLQIIHESMRTLIDKYHPDDMAIEELFFDKNITTGITVAEARGVILLSAKEKNVNIFEYTPMQVKQSVVGYGGAEKKQVIVMVRSILSLGETLKLDDTADALAIAICHAHTGGSPLKKYFNIK